LSGKKKRIEHVNERAPLILKTENAPERNPAQDSLLAMFERLEDTALYLLNGK